MSDTGEQAPAVASDPGERAPVVASDPAERAPAASSDPDERAHATSSDLDAIVRALVPLDVGALRTALDAALGVPLRGLLLYGSRARGEETAESDWDVIALVDEPHPSGVRRTWNGVDLDVDARTADELADEDGLMYLLPGRVLWDPDGAVTAFVERLQRRYDEGPRPLSKAERARSAAWVARMLRRIERNLREDPVLAAYQQSRLHDGLLELYFRWRTLWPMGPRQALRWLREHDAETWAAHRDLAEPLDAAARLPVLHRLVDRTII